MTAQLYEYIKTLNYTLWKLNYMVCELYLNQALIEKKKSSTKDWYKKKMNEQTHE